uniref:beta strand repeat-containing protein n=1 Tax=uncultured Sphingomonas sp. TaxID=158754 RepID=UPI0035CABFB2
MAALLSVAPTTVFAADGCTVPVNGTVICAPSDNPHKDGVDNSLPVGDAFQDLSIVLEPGTVIDTSGTRANGITIVNGSGGAIDVSGAGSSIITDGDRAHGVFAVNDGDSSDGNIGIVVGDVTTHGYRADGIYANNNYGGGGSISVTAGTVSVSGDGATGVRAETQTGDVLVDLSSVTATGFGGQGVTAISNYGNTTVHVGDVSTSGQSGRGITAYSAGQTTVTADTITTTGQGTSGGGDAHGIMAVGTGVLVDVGSVKTSGDYSVGIYAHTNHVQSTGGNGDIVVNAGTVATAGYGSDAIHAVDTSYGGNTKITVGTATTTGDAAWGVFAETYYGNTFVNAGTIDTRGANGTGIIALSGGNTDVKVGSVTTRGDDANGIVAQGFDLKVAADAVTTSGANSRGIAAYEPTGNAYVSGTIQIDAGTVKASGDGADGIYGLSAGSITINAGSVSTGGTHANGIYAVTYSQNPVQPGTAIVISADTITTQGDQSAGVRALGLLPQSSVSIEANHVTTGGNSADGVYGLSRTGSVRITASDVHTNGLYSNGVVGTALYGNTTVTADNVSALGNYSVGVYAGSSSGHAIVNASNVEVGSGGTAVVAVGSGVSVTTAGTIKAGDYSQALIAQSHNGDVVLHNDAAISSAYGGVTVGTVGFRNNLVIDGTGSVSVNGYYSHSAIIAGNSTGGDISITQGDVHTEGLFAAAVVASIGTGLGGVSKANDTDHMRVDLQNVSTTGFEAAGISLLNDSATGRLSATGVPLTGDAVAMVHGALTTAGIQSRGVNIYSSNGLAGAQVNAVSTLGTHADALHLNGQSVVVNATGTVSTAENASLAIATYAGNGGIAISTADVHTTGIAATAIRAASHGDITITGTGTITTGGDGSAGIQATEDRRHRELANYIPSPYYPLFDTPGWPTFGKTSRVDEVPVTGRTIAIAANAITTSGSDADGIFASGSTGALKIISGTVAVSGTNSIGIFAEDKTVAADTGTTSSAKAAAISLHAFDGVSLNVRGAATSGTSNAIELQGSNVAVSIAAGGSVQGATNAIVVDATPHVTPIVKYWGQTFYGYTPPDQPLSPIDPAPGKVSLTNAGTIVGGSGYAITVTGGSVSVTNAGMIRGAVSFAGGDDLFTNSGTFEANKDSDFGAGTDVFANSGIVRVLPGTTAAGHVTLVGLERFENNGLVDLRNGHVGDTLTLPGAFVGSGSSTIGLDVKLGAGAATGSSDQLVIGGAATGSTAIRLNVLDAATATMGRSPTALIKVGAGSSATAFTVTNPDIGFVRYALSYDAATASYGLVGAAGAPVYRTLNLGEGVQNVWNRGTDNWEAHLADQREVRWATGEGTSRLWGQAYAGGDSRKDAHAASGSSAVALDYHQSYYGAQIGYDIGGIASDAGGTVFGVTASYINSRLDSRSSADRSALDTLSLGAYASFVSNRFFASGIVQFAHDWVKTGNSQLAWSAQMTSDLYGGAITAGYRLGTDNFYVEPLASLSAVHASLGSLSAFGQSIDFDGENGVRGKAGARIGGAKPLKGGGKVVFYASGTAVHQFSNDGGLTFTSGGTSQRIGNTTIGDYGQGTLGVTFISNGRFSGFVEGNGDVGGSFDGGGGRVGVAIKF